MKSKTLTVLALLGLGFGLQAQSVNTVVTNVFQPHSVATDLDNNLYMTESGNHRILKYTQEGVLVPLAGWAGQAGTADGTGIEARFSRPQGIVFTTNVLVVADCANHTLRTVTLDGAVSTLAGAAGVPGLVDGAAALARFRTPAGLATDTNGNVYIADSGNNAIRMLDTNGNVTTIATGFNRPAAVAVGTNNEVWVADTLNHMICRIDRLPDTNRVTVVAGTKLTTGSTDSPYGTSALFNTPSGLFFMGRSGLLVADTLNHTLRRIFWTNNNYTVVTVAGLAGVAGYVDASPLSAKLNKPIGIARDVFGSGFVFADSANNALRRWQNTAALVPVSDPKLGFLEWVRGSDNIIRPYFHEASSAVFTDEAVLAVKAEPGTITYMTYAPTPSDPLESIPDPKRGSRTPQTWLDDGSAESLLADEPGQAMPDVTIKVISVQDGRPPSKVTTARFQFNVANPSVNGNNAAQFTITDRTPDALIYYTTDGTYPGATNGLAKLISSGQGFSIAITNDLTVNVRAYRTGFRPSDVVTKTFTRANFVGNKLSFGFLDGQLASSCFKAAAGQRFYAPVTLTTLPGQKMYSLQFDALVSAVTNLPADPPLVGSNFMFRSMLMKPVEGEKDTYTTIPPYMAAVTYYSVPITNTFLGTNIVEMIDFPVATLTNLVFTNATDNLNLLAVNWVERSLKTNLYNTLQQDLITYSMAHDFLLKSSDPAHQVILGGYSFVVPPDAADGQKYQIRLARASATSDGVCSNVVMELPTNGSYGGTNGGLNSIKHVTVESVHYLVGDVGSFRWFNAGDFGDTNLWADDVMQVFQSAVYRVNMPPEGSDFFNAMDSSNGTTNTDQSMYFLNGGDRSIDNITMGDGVLDLDDVFVTYRRSMDPTLKWYARYWDHGTLRVEEVPNLVSNEIFKPTLLPQAPAPTVAAMTKSLSPISCTVGVDDMQAAPGQNLVIPIRIDLSGGLPLRYLMMNVSVLPLDGSPDITNQIAINLTGLATPDTSIGASNSIKTANNFSACWFRLDPSAQGLLGPTIMANLYLTVPATATTNSAYLVRFDRVSASPNGLALYPVTVRNGLILFGDRSTSSIAGDCIPDFWRLRYFGSVTNSFAAANFDADWDGVSNLAEFQAGTNPVDGFHRINLMNAAKLGRSNFNLQWPAALNTQYVIEATTTLGGQWLPVASNLVGNGGIQQFIDNNATSSNRFYRIRVQ